MAKQSAADAANYLHVRNDWLARRKEPILEPELPIIDPHHHLWDRDGWRYLLDELLADTNSGHNILATVFVQARAMLRADGPEEMKPVGEIEFVNGVAAMTASGIYGKIRACAGIVGHADLMLGSRVEPVLEALERAGGGRFRGIRHIVAWDADPQVRNPGNPARARNAGRQDIPRGLRGAGADGLLVRCLALSSAARRTDRASPTRFPTRRSCSITAAASVGINAYKNERSSRSGRSRSRRWRSGRTST